MSYGFSTEGFLIFAAAVPHNWTRGKKTEGVRRGECDGGDGVGANYSNLDFKALFTEHGPLRTIMHG